MICTKLRSSICSISHSEKAHFAWPPNRSFVRRHDGLSICRVLVRAVKVKAANGVLHVKLVLKSKGYRSGAANE